MEFLDERDIILQAQGYIKHGSSGVYTKVDSRFVSNAVKHFNYRFNLQTEYLERHFVGSLRRWLARKILGKKAIYNMLYDSAQIGWSIGSDFTRNNIGEHEQKEGV